MRPDTPFKEERPDLGELGGAFTQVVGASFWPGQEPNAKATKKLNEARLAIRPDLPHPEIRNRRLLSNHEAMARSSNRLLGQGLRENHLFRDRQNLGLNAR
jgi:hypothetical protein